MRGERGGHGYREISLYRGPLKNCGGRQPKKLSEKGGEKAAPAARSGRPLGVKRLREERKKGVTTERNRAL